MGGRRRNIEEALELLERAGARPIRVSSLYETEPVGPRDQPHYLNAVCQLETERPPQWLMTTCLEIEARMGRVRRERWGPRVIDLDLLFYGSLIVRSAPLTLPHPRLAQRRFVLEPLAELAPGFSDPVSGKTIRQLLADCPDTGRVTRLQSD